MNFLQNEPPAVRLYSYCARGDRAVYDLVNVTALKEHEPTCDSRSLKG